ncbi:MAG: TatD family hydrolase [Flavobacteriaceae bacterium]
MLITDTHTHLYSEAFDADRDTVIQSALDAGIQRFFVPAIDSTYTQAMFHLRDTYPDHVYLMMGLHPTHVKENFKEELAHVEKMLAEHTFHAVGEIGIDLYWDKGTLAIQREAFQYQIQLAKRHKLPIVIHCREAFDAIFDVLEMEKGDDLFGIFHCFTGTKEQAERVISFNMKLGIGGVVTFKNGKIDQFLHEVDLKHIVLETDSPYLAPVPHRGKRNDAVYLLKVLQKVGELYGMPIDQVARITTENSKEVFGI